MKRKKRTPSRVSNIQEPLPDNKTTIGHGRNVKDGRSMKTSEQVVDGGNLEDRDDPLANNDSPVLVQNVTDSNLTPGKPDDD